ncbi:MAG: GntR family transcriptional regulator [Mariniphaga sp.]
MKNGKPKYITISDDIIEKIKSGELQPGDKVPSENDLIKMYSVSNTTARKSLLNVEMEGWANRIKGKGTFVLNRSQDRHITRVLGSFLAMRESFSENLKKEGFAPKNIILEKRILENGISSNINNRFFIIEGPVVKIHRLRYADDILLKDETRYISLSLCPRINMLDLDLPLIKVYENSYQLKLEKAERTIGCSVFQDNAPDNYFENDSPLAIFSLDGAIICTDGKVVELEKSYYRGDRYKFSISAKPQLIQNGKNKNVLSGINESVQTEQNV